MYSEEEMDAALCIWEVAVDPRATDHIKKRGEGMFVDWMKEGEGFAHARDNAVHLAKFCELAYIYAKHHGFDDSFDWEFVPRFCDRAHKMFDAPSEIVHEQGIAWAVWAGRDIAEEVNALSP